MYEQSVNRDNSFDKIQGLERLTDLYKHSHSLTRWEKARRLLNEGGIIGAFEWIGRKLKRTKPEEAKKLQGNLAPEYDLHLESLDTLSRKDTYFSSAAIAVYTVLFGPYDTIQDPLIKPDNIDYYIITDQKTPDSHWKFLDAAALLPQEILNDPVLCNRWCKMHPHELFPQYDVSIYVDANLLITSDLTPMAASLPSFPIAMFRHSRRDCVYDELDRCEKKKIITTKARKEQEARLRDHHIPEHAGLLEAPVIARRHHDPLCISIMEAWWQSFYKAPVKRDQILFVDTLFQMGIPLQKIGSLGADVLRCPMIIKVPHGQMK